jgi:hypothetical protein
MKNAKITSLLFLLVSASLLITTSCEKLDDRAKAEEDLIGTWTITSTSVEITAGGVDIVQLLMTAYGLTESEAKILEAAFLTDFEAELTGTITMNEDKTYSVLIDGAPDDGTWSLSIDGKTLLLDEGTVWEEELVIVSLTSSSLVLQLPAETEEVDLDDDQVAETTLTITIELTLTK